MSAAGAVPGSWPGIPGGEPGAVRGVPEGRAGKAAPQHPAQVVPALPEPRPRQAAGASAPSLTEVSLSVVNMKSKTTTTTKAPTKPTHRFPAASEAPGGKKEGRKEDIICLVHTLPNLSLPSFIQEFTGAVSISEQLSL